MGKGENHTILYKSRTKPHGHSPNTLCRPCPMDLPRRECSVATALPPNVVYLHHATRLAPSSQTAAAGGRPTSARCDRAHLWRPSLLARSTPWLSQSLPRRLSPPGRPNVQLATPVSRWWWWWRWWWRWHEPTPSAAACGCMATARRLAMPNLHRLRVGMCPGGWVFNGGCPTLAVR